MPVFNTSATHEQGKVRNAGRDQRSTRARNIIIVNYITNYHICHPAPSPASRLSGASDPSQVLEAPAAASAESLRVLEEEASTAESSTRATTPLAYNTPPSSPVADAPPQHLDLALEEGYIMLEGGNVSRDSFVSVIRHTILLCHLTLRSSAATPIPTESDPPPGHT